MDSGQAMDGDVGYFEMLAMLRKFRKLHLPEDPSNREIARALGVSPQSVTDWLAGKRFPQDIEAVVKAVRLIAARANARNATAAASAGLLDQDRWREAYGDEQSRRAGTVSAAVRQQQARNALAPGIPIADVTDPFAYEVHRPVQAEDPASQGDLPSLPPYVPRAHDAELAAVTRAAAAGYSGIAVLVGGPSTGKTRACWETIQSLTKPNRNGSWRLWHPIFPTHPEAVLKDVQNIAPGTVIWLNEAQLYLDAPDGEKVASALRELLRDRKRAPVLVLATLWREHWSALTVRPRPGDPDPHRQARELLRGHEISVPDTFTAEHLRDVNRSSDPRRHKPARSAIDGEVGQFLAGVPELNAHSRSLPAPAGGIPLRAFSPDSTGFVGRQVELTQIGELLRSSRQVTVTGVGGVGKTRVALQVASQAAGRYHDGACLIQLSALRAPTLLGHVVAASLGLVAQDTRSVLQAVHDYLCNREMLLILDTCEHLVDACAGLSETILREAPGVSLLATSREPLNVPGEYVYTLAPMSVPDSDDPTIDSDALTLFKERATAVVPGFEIDSDNRADVIRLCRRLDGIPLAIELAAIRLRALSLHHLTKWMDEKFDVLTGGRRGGVPRQQTLRGTIEWSYDLCTEAEQTMWARLSVFAGTMDVPAVAFVCMGVDRPDAETIDTFVRLVDKSVVLRDGNRYRMLDTIREFGAEQLEASGDERMVRDRHVYFYLRMARYFGDHFLDADQITRFHELREERTNLRAAMEYALSSGDAEGVQLGSELATALYGYWQVSGLVLEGRHWLSRALDRLPAGPSPARAWALIVRGYLAAFGADTAQAVADTMEGVAMARVLGDEGLLAARACLYLGTALTFANRHAEAFEAAEEAARRLEALDDRIGLLCLDADVGRLYQQTGRLAESVEACERGLRRLGNSGERWIQSYYRLLVGIALLFMGREADAFVSVSRALRMKHELGDIVGCAYALEILAGIAATKGQITRAAWILGAAHPLWEQAGGRLGADTVMEAGHSLAVMKARGGLGESRYDELFARGAALEPDEAVKLALIDADNLPSPSAWS